MNDIIRNILDYLLIIPLKFLPQRFLSTQAHKLARLENKSFKNFLIGRFIAAYKVNLEEAKRENIKDYKSFNDFFTRSLKTGARIIDTASDVIISPVDGMVSQVGKIEHDLLYQAKGHHFTLSDLLTDNELMMHFVNGQFATIYLSPKDYHRIHMPLSGKLSRAIHVPGRLWPVNPPSVRKVSSLFARNERVVCEFETKQGKMLLIMVGALFVGSIETTFEGKLTPPYRNEIKTYEYADIEFAQGDEIGRFNLGSTVILLFDKNSQSLDLQALQKLKMGLKISG